MSRIKTLVPISHVTRFVESVKSSAEAYSTRSNRKMSYSDSQRRMVCSGDENNKRVCDVIEASEYGNIHMRFEYDHLNNKRDRVEAAKQLRRKGANQETISAIIGVSQSTVSKYLNKY